MLPMIAKLNAGNNQCFINPMETRQTAITNP